MRLHYAVLVVAITGCASSQSSQTTATTSQTANAVTPSAAMATIPAELATVHQGFLRAWQGTDPAALQIYFADNAVVTTRNANFNGWPDIQKLWIAPVLPSMSNFTATPKSFTREGTDIVETGSYSFKLAQEGKTEDVVSGTYTQRWQRLKGSWRVVWADVQVQ